MSESLRTACCGTCRHWEQHSSASWRGGEALLPEGTCNKLSHQDYGPKKGEPGIRLGAEGYVYMCDFETPDDFHCSLWEDQE